MIYNIYFFVILLFFSGCSFSNLQIQKEEKQIIYEDNILHNAVRVNNIRLIKELLSKNDIDINKIDFYGYTPLHLAVRFNYFDIAKELIDNGANVNTIDSYKDTPLLDSIRSGYTDISKLLICNNANIELMDKFNKSALDYTLLKNDKYILSLLQSKNLQESCKKKQEVIKKEINEEKIIVSEKNILNNEVSISLSKLFPNLKKWNANYNKTTQTFTFNSKNIFQNENISEEYKVILNEFIPKYLEEILKYKNEVLNVYIKYTSSKKDSLDIQNNAEEVFKYIKKMSNKTVHENIIWIEKNFFYDGEKSFSDKLEFRLDSISN